MNIEQSKVLRPVAPPRIIEDAYTEDQHARLLDLVRRNGPWPLIVAHHFQSAEELIATTSGAMPEGVEVSLDMFLTPVFRGFLSHDGVCLHPEIEDCFYNTRFLDLVRDYWGAKYAEPEGMLFNIQGPCSGGGSPHLDATRFRGISLDDTPVWLMNTMAKSGLFKRWQARKSQIVAWYYRGRIGGGFVYWPDGPHAQPKTLRAPMWGRAAVVENEMMFHTAQSCGDPALRKPDGLAFHSEMGSDPDAEGGWRITTDGEVIQRIPEEEFRFLVHWGANVYMDLDELKLFADHTDDLTHERVFDVFLDDLAKREVEFDPPSDPLTDTAFITLLNAVYGIDRPLIIPPEPEEDRGIAA